MERASDCNGANHSVENPSKVVAWCFHDVLTPLYLYLGMLHPRVTVADVGFLFVGIPDVDCCHPTKCTMYKWKKKWFELIYPPLPNSSKFTLPILSSWKINWIHPSPLTPGLAQTLVMGNVIARKHISPIRLYSLVSRDSHQHAIKFTTITSLTETTRYVFHWAQLDILMGMGISTKIRGPYIWFPTKMSHGSSGGQ